MAHIEHSSRGFERQREDKRDSLSKRDSRDRRDGAGEDSRDQ